MVNLKQLNLQYVMDEGGKKRAVIVPIEEFQSLIEDLEDLIIVAERREEPTISHHDLIAELKRDGLLSD